MLPIHYTWGRSAKKHQLGPDVFVAFRPERPRRSYDVGVEGAFPPFVLEVVSPASTTRDQDEKRDAYELLDVQEYARFTPHSQAPSKLAGHRQIGERQFAVWQPDAEGRRWSDVLGLYLVVPVRLLQAQTSEGRILLTPEQAEPERRQAQTDHAREAAARQQVQADLDRAELARRRAEEEVERLRRALERYRNPET
jgi:hypothetical protein